MSLTRPEAERRQLTILFCDLVGSTPLSLRLDPEELREVIGAYHRCVAQTVEPFGGFIARYAGDGALVYFGFPQAYEDGAARGVRTALALIKDVGELRALGERLSARVGIATGVVVVGELVNSDAGREQTALGETPNLAARLQSVAEPQGIVIADSTRRLIGEQFELEDLGGIELKGFGAPMRAWKVLGVRDVNGRVAAYDSDNIDRAVQDAARRSRPLIGRQPQLSSLSERWNECRSGQGRAVFVTGGPGIGKSRLVQAFVASLAAETHYELEFRCSPYYANTPLYPAITLLPRVVGWNRADSEHTKLAKLEFFCGQHGLPAEQSLPLLLSVLGMNVTGGPTISMSAERQKQCTLHALLQIALAFAHERPLLMLVEDIQWIDPTTLELLALLVDRLPRLSVFVLATARSPFVSRWPTAAHVTAIELARLSQLESEQLIADVAQGKALPRTVVADVIGKTDGVPLFVEELTKTVLESDVLEERADRYDVAFAARTLTIPSTLHDSLAARLDRLGAAKRTAQLAAVLGREFSYAMLSAIAAMEPPVLESELACLINAEFVYLQTDRDERTYLFKHALIQETAYQSLLRSTRQRYHERIAEVMQQFANQAMAHPEIVALHYTEAGRHDAAVGWWQRAGRQAVQRAAYAEAVSHYTRGLSVLHAMPESKARDQTELDLQVDLGYSLIPQQGWGAAESARAFNRAGDLSQQIGDAPGLFRAVWGLAAFHFVRGDQFAAQRLADQCLSVALAANDTDVKIEAYYIKGTVACAAGDFVSGSDHLERCIRLHGDEVRDLHWLQYAQDAKTSALGWLALALWTMGAPDQALARAKHALARVHDATPPFVRARALGAIGIVLVLRGEPQHSGSHLAHAIETCAEQRFTYFHAILSAFAGISQVQSGSLDHGIELMQQSLARLRDIGSELLLTIVYPHLGAALGARSCVEEGLDAIEQGLGCVVRNGERWGEAELFRIRGELLVARALDQSTQAEICFRNALAIATSQHANTYGLRAATSLARLCRRLGRDDEARAVLVDSLSAWSTRLTTSDLDAARTLRAALK
jgi:class 3 adenylate cyclase/tetratricopeptide (TPR) repeat protein